MTEDSIPAALVERMREKARKLCVYRREGFYAGTCRGKQCDNCAGIADALARAFLDGQRELLSELGVWAKAEDIRAQGNRESGRMQHGSECEHAATVLRNFVSRAAAERHEGESK